MISSIVLDSSGSSVLPEREMKYILTYSSNQ